MRIDWTRFDAALERRAPTLWWRDDDAVAPSPQLDRLIALAEKVESSLTLAVIPAHATEALAGAISGHAVTVGVHGWAHENHAPPGKKKTEFDHRPVDALLTDARNGKERLEALFGATALPLFIPPWNRMAAALPDHLESIGYRGVSAFAQREMTRAGSLTRIDTHIDPIDWRGTRSVIEPQGLVDHVTALLQDAAPIGLITHHLVHDDAIWSLTEALVIRLTQYGAKWVPVAAFFASGATGAGG